MKKDEGGIRETNQGYCNTEWRDAGVGVGLGSECLTDFNSFI